MPEQPTASERLKRGSGQRAEDVPKLESAAAVQDREIAVAIADAVDDREVAVAIALTDAQNVGVPIRVPDIAAGGQVAVGIAIAVARDVAVAIVIAVAAAGTEIPIPVAVHRAEIAVAVAVAVGFAGDDLIERGRRHFHGSREVRR